MITRSAVSPLMDFSAMTLSGLCLIHCLALPVLAVILPVAGIWAEAEWVHKLFVVVALGISGALIARAVHTGGRWLFVALAALGLVVLGLSAFIEALHDYETPLTVVGAVTLASAHILHWRQHPGTGSRR